MVLYSYLKKHGLTQREFADKIGCSQSLVSQWISGETKITGQWAVAIERATERDVKRQELLPELYRGMAA